MFYDVYLRSFLAHIFLWLWTRRCCVSLHAVAHTTARDLSLIGWVTQARVSRGVFWKRRSRQVTQTVWPPHSAAVLPAFIVSGNLSWKTGRECVMDEAARWKRGQRAFIEFTDYANAFHLRTQCEYLVSSNTQVSPNVSRVSSRLRLCAISMAIRWGRWMQKPVLLVLQVDVYIIIFNIGLHCVSFIAWFSQRLLIQLSS